MSLIVHQQTKLPKKAGAPSGMVSQLAWAVATPGNSLEQSQQQQQQVGALGRLSYFASKKRRGGKPTTSAKTTKPLKPLAKTLRDLAKQRSATHYCLLTSDEGIFAGMYLPSPIQKQTAKNLHSLALAFSAMLHALHRQGSITQISGILCLSTTLSQTQMAYVAVEHGHITVDAVYDLAFAKEAISAKLASAPQLPVFFDAQSLPPSEHDLRTLAWEDLYACCSLQTLLVRVPTSPATLWSIGGLLALVALTVGTLTYQETVVKPKEQRLKLLKASQNDPTPAYAVAFSSEASKAGWAKASLIAHLAMLSDQPIFIAGWSLEGIDCKLGKNQAVQGGDVATCRYAYKRVGGTLADFQGAVDTKRTPIDMVASSVSSLVTTQQVPVVPTPLNVESLKTTSASQEVYWPFAQRLANIKDASLTQGETKRWDGFDTVGVSSGALINQTAITVATPLYLAPQVIEEMPGEILMKEIFVNVQNATLQIKGVIYAR